MVHVQWRKIIGGSITPLRGSMLVEEEEEHRNENVEETEEEEEEEEEPFTEEGEEQDDGDDSSSSPIFASSPAGSWSCQDTEVTSTPVLSVHNPPSPVRFLDFIVIPIEENH